MDRWRSGHSARDRGAVAVELALLLPVLLILVFGIIDFGRALNAQVTITQAAREGARLAALGQSVPAVQTQTATAGSSVGLTGKEVTPTVCPPKAMLGTNGSVHISYPFSFITPIGAIAGLFSHGFKSSINLQATGVMPCET